MCRLVKPAVIDRHIAQVGKVNAIPGSVDDLHHIVLGTGAQRTGAQGQAVILAGHHGQPLYRRLVRNNSWQAKDAPWRIVRVNGHLYIACLTNGHNRL